ncbi:MAG: hypothetical protein E6G94_00855, partial [Alphaproteobacteria bacterium]
MPDESRLRNEVLRAASGHILARAIQIAVQLALADRCADRPKSARELAAECGADPSSLRRLLHFLSRHGYFEGDKEGRYSLGPAGAMLRSDAPGGAAAVIRSLGSPEVWYSFDRLAESVRDGLPPEHRRGGQVYSAGDSAVQEAAFG